MTPPRAGTSPPDEALLRSIAVAGTPGAAPPPSDLFGADPSALISHAVASRMTGPLLDLADAGGIPLPDEQLEALADAHRRALLWCLHLERRLLALLDLFYDAGVRPILVKGPAIAHLDHESPHLRTFADLDLLVPGHQMDRVVEVLDREGATRPWAQPRPGYDARFAKSVTMTMGDGVEVDLHRTICDGVHGIRVPIEELHAGSIRMDLAGRSVPVPRREHRMLHSAYHLVLGSSRPSLHNLTDMVRHLCDGRIDHRSVVATARRWRGEAVLATALDEVTGSLPLELPAPWARWRADVDLDPKELAIVAAQRDEGSSFGPSRLRAALELPDRAAQLRYIAAIAWPTRAHLRDRGRDRLGRLRRTASG